jgi:hypothetical protein
VLAETIRTDGTRLTTLDPGTHAHGRLPTCTSPPVDSQKSRFGIAAKPDFPSTIELYAIPPPAYTRTRAPSCTSPA